MQRSFLKAQARPYRMRNSRQGEPKPSAAKTTRRIISNTTVFHRDLGRCRGLELPQRSRHQPSKEIPTTPRPQRPCDSEDRPAYSSECAKALEHVRTDSCGQKEKTTHHLVMQSFPFPSVLQQQARCSLLFFLSLSLFPSMRALRPVGEPSVRITCCVTSATSPSPSGRASRLFLTGYCPPPLPRSGASSRRLHRRRTDYFVPPQYA